MVSDVQRACICSEQYCTGIIAIEIAEMKKMAITIAAWQLDSFVLQIAYRCPIPCHFCPQISFSSYHRVGYNSHITVTFPAIWLYGGRKGGGCPFLWDNALLWGVKISITGNFFPNLDPANHYSKPLLIAYSRETDFICNKWGYAISEVYHTAQKWNVYDGWNVSLVWSN